MYLAGFRNRAVVLVQWAYSFFTYERSSRLITDAPVVSNHAHRSSD
jgi:NADH dehydrogenase